MNSTQHSLVIWDRFIRFFHWSLALSFLLNFWVLEAGDPPHEWVGYFIGLLLIARLVWGFIGSPNARFSQFFPTPSRLKQHIQHMRLKQYDPQEGHNPIGALMIFTLLLSLIVVSLSGWMQTWDMFWGEDWVETVHETSANLIMILVVLHVSAVLIMQHISKISLIKTMLTGKRDIN